MTQPFIRQEAVLSSRIEGTRATLAELYAYESAQLTFDEVLAKLMKIPYCIQAYDPNGLALEQFNTHPSTVSTLAAFSKGSAGLETFIGKRMAVHRR